MVFSSTEFLFIFLPLTLLGYYSLGRRFKNLFLLVVSLLFYAWGEPRFVFVMMGSILMNHFFALKIDAWLVQAEETEDQSVSQRQRIAAKGMLCLMVLFNLSLFFIYKYLNFTIRNINAVGTQFGLQPLRQTHISLPIGISFFTFQAMSYVFDVYYRKGAVQKNPLDTALYVSLFPQLIAGPIVRYETIAKEIGCRKETLTDFAEGVKRFICGLAKKVILSNSLALLADRAFDMADFAGLSVMMAWGGALAYSLQIYFDFSGYSDMAIGLGRMFGFHFEENFNYPYISKSVSEFWRRWHISLGSWFRDYVYFPLGGSRVKKSRMLLNLLVVWMLTGIWHGAAWSFFVWGFMYFILIAFEKLTGIPRRLQNRGLRWGYQAFTLLAVMFGWVIFRADGLKSGLQYIACMFALGGNRFMDVGTVFLLGQRLPVIVLAVLFSLPVVPALQKRFHALPSGLCTVCDVLKLVVYVALLVIAVSFTVFSTYNPFIYFNF